MSASIEANKTGYERERDGLMARNKAMLAGFLGSEAADAEEPSQGAEAAAGRTAKGTGGPSLDGSDEEALTGAIEAAVKEDLNAVFPRSPPPAAQAQAASKRRKTKQAPTSPSDPAAAEAEAEAEVKVEVEAPVTAAKLPAASKKAGRAVVTEGPASKRARV